MSGELHTNHPLKHNMPIKPVTLYQVFCDKCGKLFDNEEPPLRMNECHLYTSIARAEIGIRVAGWVVLSPIPNVSPRILCTECKIISQG